MSGLKIVSLHDYTAGRNQHFQQLLGNSVPQPDKAKDRTEQMEQPVIPQALQYASNQQAYIQAQILANELYRSHRRHTATKSPREAARAYGQARRRPQSVSEMPQQKNII
ncbi:hypothetical protein [uncultured Cohaesibacter sp.]|uniref:hypothetical protein n=1 Tax=uncultured Cohaesibacter sp. TaxID=1002546 RepID=UPI00293124C8|nr:hypothetical protein [uncultured Cohaesibacter sp.]